MRRRSLRVGRMRARSELHARWTGARQRRACGVPVHFCVPTRSTKSSTAAYGAFHHAGARRREALRAAACCRHALGVFFHIFLNLSTTFI